MKTAPNNYDSSLDHLTAANKQLALLLGYHGLRISIGAGEPGFSTVSIFGQLGSEPECKLPNWAGDFEALRPLLIEHGISESSDHTIHALIGKLTAHT